jgi:hypothetical protein
VPQEVKEGLADAERDVDAVEEAERGALGVGWGLVVAEMLGLGETGADLDEETEGVIERDG